jgi:DNA-directed RNA polymerase specialized sigma24 family protein
VDRQHQPELCASITTGVSARNDRRSRATSIRTTCSRRPRARPVCRREHQDLRELLRIALASCRRRCARRCPARPCMELSYQEIADRLGLPEGTVKSRINRGRLGTRASAEAAAGQTAGGAAAGRAVLKRSC